MSGMERLLLLLPIIFTTFSLIYFYSHHLPQIFDAATLYASVNIDVPVIINNPAKVVVITGESTSREENAAKNVDEGGKSAVVADDAIRKDAKNTHSIVEKDENDPDADCPFRNSPLYRKVYVYPNHGETDAGWGANSSIMSPFGLENLSKLERWPWLDLDIEARNGTTSHYNPQSQNAQYSTELMVRDILTHPKSCLRTYDPESADLFYVPYMVSTEHHLASNNPHKTNMATSAYGAAIQDILTKQDHAAWERVWGLTSKYWKRRGGADHILVMSEPLHGLWHPRSRRGHFHFLHSQYQAKPPIVVSVELSTTFVQQYGPCASKNILVPYPNPDGRWYNGKNEEEAWKILQDAQLTDASTSQAALRVEQSTNSTTSSPSSVAISIGASGRPIAQFYNAGAHGTCANVRKALKQDYTNCSPSFKALDNKLKVYKQYPLAMRMSTFCPCPGGDSPGAKRMFDAILAGCIPVILSKDFVWPFTKELDPAIYDLDPSEFSLRLSSDDYNEASLAPDTCQPKTQNQTNSNGPLALESYLQSISAQEINKLRKGVQKMASMYSWYQVDSKLPDHLLREGVLPTGGLAHAVVNAMADRAQGKLWPSCEEHLRNIDTKVEPRKFKC